MNTLDMMAGAMRVDSATRQLSEIETDQVSGGGKGGGGCDPGDRTQWVHKQGDPSWLYRDCCGGYHNIHNA